MALSSESEDDHFHDVLDDDHGVDAERSTTPVLTGSGSGAVAVPGNPFDSDDAAAAAAPPADTAGGGEADAASVEASATSASAAAAAGSSASAASAAASSSASGASASAPVWEDDTATDKCHGCSQLFTTRRRRHHCRACGLLFCGDATCTGGQYMLLPGSFGYTRPERVCERCRVLHAPFDMSSRSEALGSPDAPGLVLVHPEMHSRQFWARLAPRLADRYAVYLVDLPRHGSRRPLAEELSLDSAVRAVEAAATEHGRPVTVMGYGLGGIVAVRFADTYPEQCAGLVLMECSKERFGKLSKLKLRTQQATYASTPTAMQWNLLPELHRSLPPEGIAQCFLRSCVDYSVFSETIPLLIEPTQHWLRDAIHSFDGAVLFIESDPACLDRYGDAAKAAQAAADAAAPGAGGKDDEDASASASATTSTTTTTTRPDGKEDPNAKVARWLKPVTERKDRGGHVLIDAPRNGTVELVHGDSYLVVDPDQIDAVVEHVDRFMVTNADRHD